MSDEPRPGSNAALDRRIERLEVEVADLKTNISLIKLEQQHTRELQVSHFTTLNRGQELVLAKVEALTDSYAKAMQEGARMMGDAASTPAGRILLERIAQYEQDSKDDHARYDASLAEMQARMNKTAGAIAVGAFTLSIVAPFLWRLVGSIIGIP